MISIVMPVRNGAATLEACLDSIAAQTHAGYEIVAIDDHSTDGSLERLERRARTDDRLRVTRATGRGLVAALNQGLELAKGEIIARMDCDDSMAPERLALQVNYLDKNPEIALVASRVRLTGRETPLEGLAEYVAWQDTCLSPDEIRDQIYVEAPFAHPTVMFRKSVVQALGGYRDGDFAEDYELWLRMAQAGHAMAKLPEILVDWTDAPSRTTRTDPRYEREGFDRLRARYLAEDPRIRGPRPLVFWGAGRHTRRRCRHLIARGFRPIAWIDRDPKKIGNPLDGIPVVPPTWLPKKPPEKPPDLFSAPDAEKRSGGFSAPGAEKRSGGFSGSGEMPFVLVYLMSRDAHRVIPPMLQERGYESGRDYLLVG